METPIEQAIKWCEEHINYRSRSTKTQQEKEIYIKVKEKLESLIFIEKEYINYIKNSVMKNHTDGGYSGR